MKISLKLNGEERGARIEPRTLLVDLLRDDFRLTGAHVGCETTQCGACTVLVEGRAVKACTMLAAEVSDKRVTTIEGVATNGQALHPMQEAFRTHHGLQCGYCTPGMVMLALDLVRRYGVPDEATIRHDLKGNICRCTGYQNIVAAIRSGAEAMATGSGTE
ncbi:(2Fe-2S)-binding protein [Salipiger mucosus]|uniref:Carbon monoxide dehydrogenase small chain n=1 Tax=Salipiger mucosus DSM 16094 TaxID=1123237 RepID=S9Q553_9RHOB|nr:(2Fe-2S)-binding protein [Salipiger mucosus]EPX76481.1 Carbon monoxide dehydrogenase small chain [Salipiger mucosus DSM 16094]